MDVNIESGTALGATRFLMSLIGIFFSIIYYAPKLSKYTNIMLLFSLFVILLLVSLRIPENKKKVSIVLQIKASLVYIFLLYYSFTSLNLSVDVIFAVIFASSGLLMSISYLLYHKELSLSDRSLDIAILILLVSSVSLAGYDLSVDLEAETSLTTFENVEVSQGEYTRIANMTVENNFIFRKNIENPDYEACAPILGNPDVKVKTGISGGIEGFDSRTFGVEVSMDDSGILDVEEVESCPEDGEIATLYFYE